jgi:hypothetical protein
MGFEDAHESFWAHKALPGPKLRVSNRPVVRKVFMAYQGANQPPTWHGIKMIRWMMVAVGS